MMRFGRSLFAGAVATLVLGFGLRSAEAQAVYTAKTRLQLFGFAGVQGTEIGLRGGRNLGVEAGVDAQFLERHGLFLAAEFRAGQAVAKGHVASEKNELGGLRVMMLHGSARPYADVLFGRGELAYAPPGAQVPNQLVYYVRSSSNVYAGGGGLEYDVTSRWAWKADVQVERFSTPVTTSGSLTSLAATVGVVFRYIPRRAR